jgi:quercetin dioxygenase-like cupin family protein
MSQRPYLFIADLEAESEVPHRGIHSQTVSVGAGVEVVLFAMAAGERLNDHTSARPAVVHVIAGTGELVVAGDTHAIARGSWLRMPARTTHGLVAATPLVFALYLLPATDA